MANNPLDFKEFKHYLNFKNDDVGIIQISEPVKFDASEFVVEQGDNYARDVSFMAEEIDLEFREGFFEKAESPYELPNGLIVDRVGHAIEFIFEYNRKYGFQSHIEYILERNGSQFIFGELNFEGCDTDERTYFKCKIVQGTKRALAKRRETTKIDVFSTEGLDDNVVEPLSTTKILLKAKPTFGISEWTYVGDPVLQVFPRAVDESFNFSTSTVSYEIRKSLGFFPGIQNSDDFKYIEAEDDLSDVKIELTNIDVQLGTSNICKLRVLVGETFATATQYDLEEINTAGEKFSSELSLSLPNVSRGYSIWIYFRIAINGLGVTVLYTSMDVKISATSTAISSVIKGVKYIDLLKQSLKVCNGMDVDTEDFDSGGKFDGLYAFSGNLIRQRDDVPYYTELKDRIDNLAVFNADMQVNDDDAFVLQYDKFYDNVDNGGYIMPPNDTFKMNFNPKYTVNTLSFKFKNYETDRDEENTLDSVHTEAQFSINNTKVQNEKLIEIEDVYDPFSIEAQRRQAIKETTALDGDDKTHVIDVVPISPLTRGGFTARITHQVTNTNQLKLLNDGTFKWGILGPVVGSSFNISSEDNEGFYVIAEIEDNVLTLDPSPTIPTEDGQFLTTVDYELSGVQFVNRTNEGFDLIENLQNPDNYSNLRYTIRRNLVNWEPYISTCASYIDQNIKNTEFKNNGNLTTKYEGGLTYTENGPIDLSTISPRILTPRIYDVEVIAEYDDILELLNKYQTKETAGGFVRVQDINGALRKLYPTKIGYTWSTKSLNIIGEERSEPDIVTVTKSNGTIFINEVGYDEQTLDEVFYEANGNYIVLFDKNNVNLINFTKYDKFVVQEETFDNPTDLVQALIDL